MDWIIEIEDWTLNIEDWTLNIEDWEIPKWPILENICEISTNKSTIKAQDN